MLRLKDLRLPLEHSDQALRAAIIRVLGIEDRELLRFSVARRSFDARRRGSIVLVYHVDLETTRDQELLGRRPFELALEPTPDTTYLPPVRVAAAPVKRPVVIGMGPCGLFAALLLAEMGFRPLVLERGKKVRERTIDTFGLWRKRQLHSESNVQFGEGGAGTFSDGKLYSQVKDPGHRGRKVLTEFVAAGAPEEILYVSKPHIGTFRLVKMVEQMRAKIESLGGEILFQKKVEDFEIEDGRIRSLVVVDNLPDQQSEQSEQSELSEQAEQTERSKGRERIEVDHVVLAVGHSARDTFEMLHRRGVFLEAKPFSIGFRIEHPQSLIDQRRYGRQAGHSKLGAADYKLVHHCANGRSVYSFCMCPGGTVVAAASEPGRVVTNGMSQYSRDERNANAGMVVGISPEDYPGGPLAGIAFQRRWEERAFELGGGSYDAPGQLVGDFLADRPSTSFGSVLPSYRPGVHLTNLGEALPDFAIEALREALPAFGRTIKGFDMEDAVLTGVESRTSAPLRIRRDEALESINTRGLYPAGEGAGYAGGILSAAIDGIRVAEAVARSLAGIGPEGGR